MTLLQKILMWMRRWRERQQRFEYLEQQHERNMEQLISGLGLVVVVATVLVVLMLCGCATPIAVPQVKSVQPFTLIVLPSHYMPEKRGYCQPNVRYIYVKWDNVNNHPDFYALGHELWHLPELGGMFHK